MIQVHGPTYCYHGEILTEPTLIFVEDHHYDENNQCFQLKQLLDNSTCTHTVIFDHVLWHEEFISDPVYFPKLLVKETKEYNNQQILPDWSNKIHAFNFIINKPRIHRRMLLELVDEFKLTNYCHSLCWMESTVPSISVTDFRLGKEILLNQGYKNGSYTNAQIYQGLLQTAVVEPTCVSLITEPAYYEKETIVTEKTLTAIWGGTIPIWVGGWRIPDYMRQLGFDVFDDLVDHSYQQLVDPAERCRCAITNNLDLLKKITFVDHQRLLHNLELAKSNPWQDQFNSCLKTYPSLRTIVPSWLL